MFIVTVCLAVKGPWAEGTLSWFTSDLTLPSFTLPDVCGARVFVEENNTTLPTPTEGSGEGVDGGLGM